MSEIISWEEPPGGERRNWAKIAEALRSNPNQWAHVKGLSSSYHASYINKANSLAFAPAGSFQATARKGQVFARYIGTPDE